MPMTLEEFRNRFPDRPDPIPLEYAGKWIAVAADLHTILASGDDPNVVRQRAREAGYNDTTLRYIPAAVYVWRV